VKTQAWWGYVKFYNAAIDEKMRGLNGVFLVAGNMKTPLVARYITLVIPRPVSSKKNKVGRSSADKPGEANGNRNGWPPRRDNKPKF